MATDAGFNREQMNLRENSVKHWLAIAALLIAIPVRAAESTDDNAELLQAVRALEERIEAMSRRIVDLEAERNAARQDAANAGKLKAPAAPSDTNSARNPQDATSLPGTVAIGPSAPAWPVASGGETARVTLSGQINRALLYGDDGEISKVRNVDNNNSSTRLRIFAMGEINPDTFVGGQIETEIRSNSSASVSLLADGSNSAASTSFTERQIEFILFSRRYGRLRLGQGSTASDESTQADLSDTALAGYVQVSDFNGGFQFRETNTGDPGPAVTNVFNYFSGLGRDDRIRYDAPSWHGITPSVSAADGGAWDIALRHAGESDNFRVVGALAYADATSRDDPLPAVTPLDSKQLSGSLAMLYRPLGLSLSLAAGKRDTDFTDSQGNPMHPRLRYAKLGWQHRFFSVGNTAFSIDFAQNKSLALAGDVARASGFQAVQHFDRIGTDLFFGYRDERLDREGMSFQPLRAVMSGLRVRF